MRSVRVLKRGPQARYVDVERVAVHARLRPHRRLEFRPTHQLISGRLSRHFSSCRSMWRNVTGWLPFQRPRSRENVKGPNRNVRLLGIMV